MIIKLSENQSRGFLSNHISILTSLRALERSGEDIRNARIGSDMFSLYGAPQNWFPADCVGDGGDVVFDTMGSWDLSMWPTPEELDLRRYEFVFPFNARVEAMLSGIAGDYSDTLGIHYRGTDGTCHTPFVPLAVYLDAASQEFEKECYRKVFVATDEEGIIQKVREHFEAAFGFKSVVFHDHVRTKGRNGLHYTTFPTETKIKLGDEVLVDSVTLSKCAVVIGKTSNISNYARILSPGLKMLYQDRAAH